jgi:dienelactone hydrolase
MKAEKIAYSCGSRSFQGTLVYEEAVKDRRPLLLMSPNWLGPTEQAIKRTQTMVSDKYIGFVVDMYGDGHCATGPGDAAPLADALRSDTAERRRRISAAFEAMTAAATERGIGNPERRAAVGFCFGGGNVLELARTGVEFAAAICLHGDLASPLPAKLGDVHAALFVMHGAADPVAPKAQRDAFEAEMEAAKAKWQMLTFGGLVHSFCEIEADIPGIAEFNPPAAHQCFRLIDQFLADAFDERL